MSSIAPRNGAKAAASTPADKTLIRTATFPRTPGLSNHLRGAALRQNVGEHNFLTLTYKGRLTLTKASKKKASVKRRRHPIKAGDPVTFSWTVGSSKCKFVGYVHAVKTTGTPSTLMTIVTCIGASKALRKPKRRVFRNLTATAVATKIIKQVKLEPVVHSTSHVMPAVSQPGLTDWQVLRKLSAETGHGLFVNNTTVYFVDIDKWIRKKLATSRSFTYRKQNMPNGIILGQNMYSWKAYVPDNIADPTALGGDIEVAVDDAVIDNLSDEFNYIDESSDLYELDDVEVGEDYLETFGLEPDTTADDLLDSTPAIIEEESA